MTTKEDADVLVEYLMLETEGGTKCELCNRYAELRISQDWPEIPKFRGTDEEIDNYKTIFLSCKKCDNQCKKLKRIRKELTTEQRRTCEDRVMRGLRYSNRDLTEARKAKHRIWTPERK